MEAGQGTPTTQGSSLRGLPNENTVPTTEKLALGRRSGVGSRSKASPTALRSNTRAPGHRSLAQAAKARIQWKRPAKATQPAETAKEGAGHDAPTISSPLDPEHDCTQPLPQVPAAKRPTELDAAPYNITGSDVDDRGSPSRGGAAHGTPDGHRPPKVSGKTSRPAARATRSKPAANKQTTNTGAKANTAAKLTTTKGTERIEALAMPESPLRGTPENEPPARRNPGPTQSPSSPSTSAVRAAAAKRPVARGCGAKMLVSYGGNEAGPAGPETPDEQGGPRNSLGSVSEAPNDSREELPRFSRAPVSPNAPPRPSQPETVVISSDSASNPASDPDFHVEEDAAADAIVPTPRGPVVSDSSRLPERASGRQMLPTAPGFPHDRKRPLRSVETGQIANEAKRRNIGCTLIETPTPDRNPAGQAVEDPFTRRGLGKDYVIPAVTGRLVAAQMGHAEPPATPVGPVPLIFGLPVPITPSRDMIEAFAVREPLLLHPATARETEDSVESATAGDQRASQQSSSPRGKTAEPYADLHDTMSRIVSVRLPRIDSSVSR